MRRIVSLAITALVAMAGVGVAAGPAGADSAVQAHGVPQDCSALDPAYFPPLTAAQSSVRPGVIVADSTFPPTTYTPYTIDDTGHLSIIGPFSTIYTTDRLVAAWQSSTDCYGLSDSRNAWVADSSGRVR
jgi:hypothetical protein